VVDRFDEPYTARKFPRAAYKMELWLEDAVAAARDVPFKSDGGPPPEGKTGVTWPVQP
jgi:hypothetical protein